MAAPPAAPRGPVPASTKAAALPPARGKTSIYVIVAVIALVVAAVASMFLASQPTAIVSLSSAIKASAATATTVASADPLLPVQARGLVTVSPTAASVLEHHALASSLLPVSNNSSSSAVDTGAASGGLSLPATESLCYVTPWNRHGYDLVQQAPHRFPSVSPVWHSLKFRPAPSGSAAAATGATVEAYLDGEHDVDVTWLSAITGRDIGTYVAWFNANAFTGAGVDGAGEGNNIKRMSEGTADDGSGAEGKPRPNFPRPAHRPRVLPRVLAEPSDELSTRLFSEPAVRAQIVQLLTDLVMKYDYDGLTLEWTYFWPVAGEYPDHPQHTPGLYAQSTADLTVGAKDLTKADLMSPRHVLNLLVRQVADSVKSLGEDIARANALSS